MARSIRKRHRNRQEASHVTIAIPNRPGEYRAGACNIGPEEIARRRRMGGRPAPHRGRSGDPPARGRRSPGDQDRGLCVPRRRLHDARASATSVLRSVRLGGCPQLRPRGGRAERIEDDEARAADRRTALMVAYCALAAAAVTALFVVVPGQGRDRSDAVRSTPFHPTAHRPGVCVPTTPVPTVEFSDQRLSNGLRLIVAEDPPRARGGHQRLV